MSWELLGFAALFGLVLMATPGPANLSLMAVSASVGFQRARLYLFGIWVGGFLVTALVGLGVGALLQAQPLLYGVLQVVGLGYIAWLAWRLAHLDGSHGTTHAEPSFWAGAALHPLNPKAYVMNVTAFASFIAPGMAYDAQAVFLGITLGLIMIVCTTTWALGGEMLRHWLTQARYARVVRQVLAVAMVASVAIPMLMV